MNQLDSLSNEPAYTYRMVVDLPLPKHVHIKPVEAKTEQQQGTTTMQELNSNLQQHEYGQDGECTLCGWSRVTLGSFPYCVQTIPLSEAEQSTEHNPDESRPKPVTISKLPEAGGTVEFVAEQSTELEDWELFNWLENRFERFVCSADSLFGEEIYDKFNRNTDELRQIINQEVVKELEWVLSHASGGGSWRRVIMTRLAELERRSK